MKYSERSHPCLVCATAKNRCKPLRDGGGSCCDSCWTVGREILHETQQEHDDRKHPMHTGNRSDEPLPLPDPQTAMQVIDPTYGFPGSRPEEL